MCRYIIHSHSEAYHCSKSVLKNWMVQVWVLKILRTLTVRGKKQHGVPYIDVNKDVNGRCVSKWFHRDSNEESKITPSTKARQTCEAPCLVLSIHLYVSRPRHASWSMTYDRLVYIFHFCAARMIPNSNCTLSKCKGTSEL